jgi:hypothetical protein
VGLTCEALQPAKLCPGEVQSSTIFPTSCSLLYNRNILDFDMARVLEGKFGIVTGGSRGMPRTAPP